MNTTKSCKMPTSIRLPVELEERIRESAAFNELSISNEIIFILRQYYKDREES